MRHLVRLERLHSGCRVATAPEKWERIAIHSMLRGRERDSVTRMGSVGWPILAVFSRKLQKRSANAVCSSWPNHLS